MMIRKNFIAEEGVVVPDDLDTGYNVVLRKDVKVGKNVKIWSGTVVDPGAVIGDNVRIHCNVYISQGCIIEDDVFIGPGTVLLNDKYPVRQDPECWEPVHVKKGAIIGGGCTILPGVTVGLMAVIGAGAVLTHDVPAYGVQWGNPAHGKSGYSKPDYLQQAEAHTRKRIGEYEFNERISYLPGASVYQGT